MRLGALLLLAAVASSAGAQTCRKLEFAEIDSLSKDQLLTMRCQYADALNDRRVGVNDAVRCASELPRFDRVIARKNALPEPATARINAACTRQPPRL
jgi:hypothetical protein